MWHTFSHSRSPATTNVAITNYRGWPHPCLTMQSHCCPCSTVCEATFVWNAGPQGGNKDLQVPTKIMTFTAQLTKSQTVVLPSPTSQPPSPGPARLPNEKCWIPSNPIPALTPTPTLVPLPGHNLWRRLVHTLHGAIPRSAMSHHRETEPTDKLNSLQHPAGTVDLVSLDGARPRSSHSHSEAIFLK
jgi:hypothetical protein